VTRGLFLDRDGTLIVDAEYPRDPDRVELLPNVIEALLGLQRSFALVIVSNQSGIGRGLVSEAEARAVHERAMSIFLRAGIGFAGALYCPHAPEIGCECRKPAPGMLLTAAREYNLDLGRSVMIGDKASDIVAGRAAGCGHTIRFGHDYDGVDGSARCDDWIAVRRFFSLMIE
jgi:D-glycero-D-manno-heptose 1,7-bisphosphate phosphatase